MTFDSQAAAIHEVLRWMHGKSALTADEVCIAAGAPVVESRIDPPAGSFDSGLLPAKSREQPSEAKRALIQLGNLYHVEKLAGDGGPSAAQWVSKYYQGDSS